MVRVTRGQENNELKKDRMLSEQNKEEVLEISSTGYGYETVQESADKIKLKKDEFN